MIIIGSEEKKKKDELLKFKEDLNDPEKRKKYFQGHNDTFKGIGWSNFTKVIESYDFVKEYDEDFEGDGKVTEHEVIFYNKDTGIIVHAYSKGGICLDAANLYAEIDAPFELDLRKHQGFSNSESLYHDDTHSICLSTDVSEGFIYKMDFLTMNFEFHKEWKSHEAPNFINYMEAKYKTPDKHGLVSYAKVKKSDALNKTIYSHYAI